MNKSAIVYVMGVTCSGKDTLIQQLCEKNPTLFCSINVGAEFRRRYPPGHFKGLGAMGSTEAEALEIFNTQLAEAVEKPQPVILVSGQPRLVSQIKDTVVANASPDCVANFWWLHANDDVLESRVNSRFPLDSEDYEQNRALAYQRLRNDRIQMYDVIHELSVMIRDQDDENPVLSDILPIVTSTQEDTDKNLSVLSRIYKEMYVRETARKMMGTQVFEVKSGGLKELLESIAATVDKVVKE